MKLHTIKNNYSDPSLRFSGFTKKWETKTLAELGDIISGLTYSPNDIDSNGVLVLRSSNIQDRKLSFEDNVFVKVKKDEFNPVEENDILICVRNGSKNLIGKNAIIDKRAVGMAFGAFMAVFRSEYNPYLFQVFDTDIYNKQVYRNLGATINSINGYDLKKFFIPFPEVEEQQKIASFLSSIDDWIENLTQQKLALEKYKKGMMQKLFSQELRFKNDKGNNFPAWEEKMLGDICEYKNGGSFENNIVENGNYNLITLNSIDIDGRLKSGHKKVSSADWYLEKGDLIMVLSDVAHGNFLGLVDVIQEDNKFVLNQRMGLLRKKDNNVDLNFLRTFINFNQSYFKRYGQGSSQLNLSKGDVLKFKVKIPHLDEQKKISNMLETMEQMIAIKNSELLFTEEWKEGLMQKLFI